MSKTRKINSITESNNNIKENIREIILKYIMAQLEKEYKEPEKC